MSPVPTPPPPPAPRRIRTLEMGGRTFTRSPEGLITVVARQGIVVDMFRDDRGLDVVAREWLGGWG